MKNIYKTAAYLSLFLMILGCGSTTSKKEYKETIDSWHQKRIKNLTKKDSWLSLAGLYWLQEGKNSFGSDSTNDLVFPKGKSPEHIGYFSLQDTTVRIKIKGDNAVMNDDKSITQMTLKTDQTGHPTVLHEGSLSWYVIRRGDRFGVRLKDSQSARLKNFKGINRFPVNTKWRVQAMFLPYDVSQTIKIPTIIGQMANVTIPGKLVFKINGTSYNVLPIQESPDSNTFFIVFGDQTNGKQTYGGGRFLDVDKPRHGNVTFIDFNKAYNPPCAFSRFATCPLPPPQNRLSLAVKAGEKKYGKHQYHKNIHGQ